MKRYLGIMAFSILLLATSFTQTSFGYGDYDLISKWGSFGINTEGHFSHPQFITTDSNGTIYVSDLGNKRIQKFSSDGEFISQWGKSGKQPGDFHYPAGLAAYNGSIFVVDHNLNKVQKFSTDGEFITSWGDKGHRDGDFFYPNGIAINNGTVYVVDTGNNRVQIFSTDGEFISSFGSSGLGDGQFLTAVGIDIDLDGNLYITDKGNGKIEKFDANGEFLESFVLKSSRYAFVPEAVAVDPDGKLFIINSANGKILHISQNSTSHLSTFDKQGPFSHSFASLADITIGINGELLIVNSAQHSIMSYKTPFYQKPVSSIVEEIPIVNFDSDITKPSISAPASITIEAVDKQTFAPLGKASATDASGIQTIINNSPDFFTPGDRTVVWTAIDNAGLSSSDSQLVTIKTCGQNHLNYNLIEGTADDDVILGTAGDDLIFGLAGNDLISGGAGNDCIFGGSGDDIISGADGDDTIRGNFGNDILKGQLGNDIIYPNFGSDVVDGGAGFDKCHIFDSDLSFYCEE